ncbi:MAG: Uma2 family endonuclease [bacterium]|nr:Uma2 family endonuclease [bacterium]
MAVDVQAFIEKIRKEPAFQDGIAALLNSVQEAGVKYISYDEFLEEVDEDSLAEWVDGETIMSSPASLKHQDIGGFLSAILRMYVEQHALGKLIIAPFQMKLERSGREPDLIFVKRENLERLQKTYLDGPADLAVEIISPESVGRDRGWKFIEYEENGVLEYWLIDPIRSWTECYHLNESGQYDTLFAGQEGRYQSQVIEGLHLRIEWLWQTPLPPLLEVLKELQLL